MPNALITGSLFESAFIYLLCDFTGNLIMKNNLKLYREQANLTLQEFSDMYGGTKSHLWALEIGKSAPTLPKAYAIACALDKTVYEIWPDTTKVIEETVVVRRVKLDT